MAGSLDDGDDGVRQTLRHAVGEHDAKFRAIAEGTAERLADAVVSVVEGAGHSAHLEAPLRTADAIAGWLDRYVAQRG